MSMSLMETRKKPEPQNSYIFRSEDPVDLLNILNPNYSIGIWKRNPILEIENFLKTIPTNTIFSIREMIPAQNPDLESILAFSNIPTNPAFIEDLNFLVELYSDLLGAERIGIRLANLREAMCPKFHVDFVGIRLICTYTGPGTEFLENNSRNRHLLGHQSHDCQIEPDSIQSANPFDLVLLKGENWPNNKNCGAIHRSPSVEPGKNRIILTMDAVY